GRLLLHRGRPAHGRDRGRVPGRPVQPPGPPQRPEQPVLLGVRRPPGGRQAAEVARRELPGPCGGTAGRGGTLYRRTPAPGVRRSDPWPPVPTFVATSESVPRGRPGG